MGAGCRGCQRDRSADTLRVPGRVPGRHCRPGAGLGCQPLPVSGPPPDGPLDVAYFPPCHAGGASRPGARRHRDYAGTGPPRRHHLQQRGGRSGCGPARRPPDDRGQQMAASLYQPQFLHQHGGRQGFHPDRGHRPHYRHHHGLRHRGDIADYRALAARTGPGGCRDLRRRGFLPGGADRGRVRHHERGLPAQAGTGPRTARNGPAARFPSIDAGSSFPRGPAA